MHNSIIKNNILLPLILSLSLLITSTAFAASPVGTWRTIDDNTGEAISIIKIYPEGNTLQGKIVKLLPAATLSVCQKCPGERRGKPLTGIVIMWGYKADTDGSWDSGKILDPTSGKVYKSSMKVSPDGQHLSVRGYIGLSIVGRTQTWQRLPSQ